MPKTKYIATDPNGDPHTRSSDRVYTHTVVFLSSYDQALANADKDWEMDGKNWLYYRSVIDGNGRANGEVMHSWMDAAYLAKQVDTAKANSDMFASRDDAIAGGRAKRVAKVEELRASGYYDTYQNYGWCGRHDLAQKLAARTPGLSVTILEVTTK